MSVKHLLKLLERRISDAYEELNEDKIPDENVFYPNNIGTCMRYNYYRHFILPDLHIRAKGRIMMSSIVERMFLDVLKEHGYEVQVPFRKTIDGDIVISGRVDAINSSHVIEIKTITPPMFDKVPIRPHKYQLNTYLWLSDRPYGYLVYFKSDNPAIYRYFKYRFDRDLHNKLMDWVRELHRYIQQRQLPPPSISNYCKTCPFKKLCAASVNPAGEP